MGFARADESGAVTGAQAAARYSGAADVCSASACSAPPIWPFSAP